MNTLVKVRMMNITKRLTVLFALLAPFALQGQAFSFFEDFQSTTPGQFPNGSGYPSGVTVTPNTGTSGEVYVVGSETAFPDPFGPSGNQSLMLQRVGATTPGPQATFSTPHLEFGEISYKLWIDPTTPAAQRTVDLNLGNSSTSGGTAWNALQMRILGGTLRLTDGGSTVDGSGLVQIDQEMSIRLLFSDNSYSVYLNDVLVDIGGKTVFQFANAVGSVNTFQFASGWNDSRNTARFYIDDLSIGAIPEASHAAILAGVALLLIVGIVRYQKIRSR